MNKQLKKAMQMLDGYHLVCKEIGEQLGTDQESIDEDFKTIENALDTVRWRDPEKELPELGNKSWVEIMLAYYYPPLTNEWVPEIQFGDFFRVDIGFYDKERGFYTEDNMTIQRELVGWQPLPKWSAPFKQTHLH